MKYMLLIYHDEPSWAALSEAERQQVYVEFRKLRADLVASGQFVTGSQLQPISTATTVRVRDGERMLTDGPYAETKEQLGGYYLLECKDLDDALNWAAQIPEAKTGSIEVRPIMDYEALMPGSTGAEAAAS